MIAVPGSTPSIRISVSSPFILYDAAPGVKSPNISGVNNCSSIPDRICAVQADRRQVLRNRVFAFLIPWFMDGGIVFLQTAMPLMVVRLGASALLLGSIGWIGQAFRLPVCLFAGQLSERVGRVSVIVPAACLFGLGCVLMSSATSPWQVLPCYVIALASIGSFYPPLQALIGDVSQHSELRKSLGAFNLGWCTGSAVAALCAPILVGSGLARTLQAGAGASFTAALLVLCWRWSSKRARQTASANGPSNPPSPESLLLLARIGHFVSYYGYSTIRIMFPKYAISGLGWSDVLVAWATAQHLVGLGLGVALAGVSGWWRGKLWPIAGALAMMMVSGAVGAISHTLVPTALAFFAFGFSQSVVYTAALYYGLSAAGNRGRNAGVHESLVAAGGISGCLLGGIAAQQIGLAAPLVLLAVLSGLALVLVLFLGFQRKQ
ncbi:MAG: MFS transporter [Armatimonadota bacterium]|nr:MFS transporter [Armatimonadota bacterium]